MSLVLVNLFFYIINIILTCLLFVSARKTRTDDCVWQGAFIMLKYKFYLSFVAVFRNLTRRVYFFNIHVFLLINFKMNFEIKQKNSFQYLFRVSRWQYTGREQRISSTE